MISDIVALLQGIHMIFSIVWWSVTFLVIFIIRPSNRTGNLSIVLPKIRRIIIFTSTISLTSGLILFVMLFNFEVPNFVYTAKGVLILLFGSLSLIVYYHVLRGTYTSSLTKNIHINIDFIKFLPHVMFGLLTTTMIFMVIASRIVVL